MQSTLFSLRTGPAIDLDGNPKKEIRFQVSTEYKVVVPLYILVLLTDGLTMGHSILFLVALKEMCFPQ